VGCIAIKWKAKGGDLNAECGLRQAQTRQSRKFIDTRCTAHGTRRMEKGQRIKVERLKGGEHSEKGKD
jgi:hypothetical protein